ncbi:MAG: response regulator [Magnetococcales bacterium]|nr:response regulator [Magnetococcales bacterium]
MTGILIVDDNEEEVRQPLVRWLGRIFGADRIVEAANGREALEALQADGDSIGVVVLDIMMPVLDGIDTCREIRANAAFEGLYIVMLTGRDGGLPEGLKVGADVYLRKPCAIEELVAVVGRGLQHYERHRLLQEEKVLLGNRLHRVEAENDRLQADAIPVVLPVDSDSRGGWTDLVDGVP